MSEIIIVIVVLGLLAAIAVPVYNNVRSAGAENVKIKNADMLNELMTAVHNGGVDTSGWTTGKLALDALSAGVDIRTSSGTVQQIKLQKTLNPNAYLYVQGDATKAPTFTADLSKPSELP